MRDETPIDGLFIAFFVVVAAVSGPYLAGMGIAEICFDKLVSGILSLVFGLVISAASWRYIIVAIRRRISWRQTIRRMGENARMTRNRWHWFLNR